MTPIEENPLTCNYEVVYLATFPRSGNHWMRYLIEEVTGIATSSIYCDKVPQHSHTLYPWNGYLCEGGYEGNRRDPLEGEIVVLKTHKPTVENNSEGKAPRVLRIVRHPIDSIYSHYVLKCTRSNVDITSPIPQDFLESAIKSWKIFQEYYNSQENVLTFLYEDFVETPFEHLKQAVHFIGYRATDGDIQRAVERYPPNSIHLKHIHHYTDEQLAQVQTELQPLMQFFGYQIPKISSAN